MYIKTIFNLKNKKKLLSGEFYASDFHRCSPSSPATINKNNADNEINITREDSYISLQNSCISCQLKKTQNVAANTKNA